MGIIALDIDGTITDSSHNIPKEIAHFLHNLYDEGWKILFVTGRTYSYALEAINVFDFPYEIGFQNGADILHMPSKEHLVQHYFSKELLLQLEKKLQKSHVQLLPYSGMQDGDYCYYKESNLPKELALYYRRLEEHSSAPWQKVETFSEIKRKKFPILKVIGEQQELFALEKKITDLPVITSIIKDPMNPNYHFLLINHASANKGAAIASMIEKKQYTRPLICAGDDRNDISLLEVGDFKIAMGQAPEELKKMADYVTKTGSEKGIIPALLLALDRVQI